MINWAMTPLTEEPKRLMSNVANRFDRLAEDPQTSRTFDPNSYLGKYEDYANKFNAQVRGGISGMIEGVGDYASGMTSPLALAGSAIGMSPWLRGAEEVTSLGRMVPPKVSPIGPSMSEIPKEWLASGMEDAYNASKSIARPLKSAADVAYENIMRNGGRSSNSVGSNMLLNHMQKVQQAKMMR